MGDLINAIQTLNLVGPIEPLKPDPANLPAFEEWKYKLKEHQIKLQEYNNFRAGLYILVLGQYMDVMQDYLKSHHNFPVVNCNSIVLLVIIHVLIHTFEEWQETTDSINDVKETFYATRQRWNMSLQ